MGTAVPDNDNQGSGSDNPKYIYIMQLLQALLYDSNQIQYTAASDHLLDSQTIENSLSCYVL
jgi:hypothetical protein